MISINLVNEDCNSYLKEVEDNSIDMIFTDPPYNISHKGDLYRDDKWTSYSSHKGDWDLQDPGLKWIEESYRVLKPHGIFACFGLLGSLSKVLAKCEDLDMRFQSHIVWHKTNPAPSRHCRMLTHSNEIILVYSKQHSNWYFDYKKSKEQCGGKQQHNHIEHASIRKIAGVTAKPIPLGSRYVEIFCPEFGVVLDPFCGSGNLCIGATLVSRSSIGIEKHEYIYKESISNILSKLKDKDINMNFQSK